MQDDATTRGSTGSGRPRPPGLARRVLETYRHLAGLIAGAILARAASRRASGQTRGVRAGLVRGAASILRPFVARDLRDASFPVQLRRRLELLGPTYIKLGQILSLREDILPREVTHELTNLLDHLPVVPFDEIAAVIERDLQRPIPLAFASIEREPIGSASIGQTHLATTLDGERVVVKVIKPGIREVLQRDALLLGAVGWLLQRVFGRFQPQRIIEEFVVYTLREVDLRREADNAETFASNFKDLPDVVFPRIHRALSGPDVLTMEYLDGFKPTDPRVEMLADDERTKLIDVGAAVIIRMIYQDGFFHADLHPGNLLIVAGPRCGFIDLGMVGRFDEELRRMLMYYFYCLVVGDAESAGRYLLAVAEPGPGADPHGFRKEVEDVARRWSRAATFRDFSIGRLILESVSRAAHYRLYFPVEMVLMVKALVTFEGVGQLLKPGFDVAAVSQAHIRRIFLNQFSPWRVARDGLRGAPELVDALIKAPMLMTEGMRLLERSTRQPAENPLAGVRTALLAGACLVGAVITLVTHGPAWLWVALFTLAAVFALRK